MKLLLLAAFATFGIATFTLVGGSATTYAQFEGGVDNGVDMARGADQPRELFSGNEGDVFSQITSLLLFVIGVLSVIMLIIGGFKFVLSGGDKAKTTAARNTILYAIIGLLIAFFSYAIINFILQTISGGGGGLGGSGDGGFGGIW